MVCRRKDIDHRTYLNEYELWRDKALLITDRARSESGKVDPELLDQFKAALSEMLLVIGRIHDPLTSKPS